MSILAAAFFGAFLPVLLPAANARETANRIRVHLSPAGHEIDPLVFGHFTELTLSSYEGGILSEWLANRKFERPDDPDMPQSLRQGISPGWEPIGMDRDIILQVDPRTCYSPPWSQRITLTAPGRGPAGIQQRGFQTVMPQVSPDRRLEHPFRFQAGQGYRVRLAIKAAAFAGEVHVALGEAPGQTVARHSFRPTGGDWQVYHCELTPDSDAADACFMVFIDSPGTVWIDSLSLTCPAQDEAGLRRDALELTRRLQPPIIRFPGGSMVDDYHWQDGIGPIDARPTTYNRNWRCYTTNDMGTAEFVDLCRRVGAEPYLCVNTGTGTAEEAAAWVEYCNGDAATQWGSVRARHGHPQPFGVRYWGIGNETAYGHEIGRTNGVEYGQLFLDFARAMRAADPDIKLVAVGVVDVREDEMRAVPRLYEATRYWIDWTKDVMAIAGREMDYYSIHYYGPQNIASLPTDEEKIAACLAIAEDLSCHLDEARSDLAQYAPPGRIIPLALDEWAMHAQGGPALWELGALMPTLKSIQHVGLIGSMQSLAAALADACILNLMQDRAGEIGMGCRTLLYAYAGGSIGIGRDQVIMTPPALTMELYATRDRCRSLKTEVEGETFTVRPVRPPWRAIGWKAVGEFPYLHVSARLHSDGETVELFVVNRHPSDALECALEWTDGAIEPDLDVAILTGPHIMAWLRFDQPPQVQVTSKRVAVTVNPMVYSFEPRSVTRITARIASRP